MYAPSARYSNSVRILWPAPRPAFIFERVFTMTAMHRISVAWQNWPGAPGVSQLFMTGGIVQANVDAVRSFFNAMVGVLPSGLTIQVPSIGDDLDDATGKIVGAWNVATTPPVVTGTATGAYPGNAGAVIHWQTALVKNGRRVRGRTFIVPLSSATAYESNGSLSSTTITTLQTAANGLVTALTPNFCVWHRPTGFSGGEFASIASAKVPDLAVSLRSRRQ